MIWMSLFCDYQAVNLLCACLTQQCLHKKRQTLACYLPFFLSIHIATRGLVPIIANFSKFWVSSLCRVINFECIHSKQTVVIIKINHTITKKAHLCMYDNCDRSVTFSDHCHPESAFMCLTESSCGIIRNKFWYVTSCIQLYYCVSLLFIYIFFSIFFVLILKGTD